MAREHAQQLVGEILAEQATVATLERAESLEEFLDELLTAGNRLAPDFFEAEARQAVEEAFAAVHGHEIMLEELVCAPRLEEELKDVELQLNVQSSPVNLLAGAIHAAWPPMCWTTQRWRTKGCSA